jgi:predicted ATPase
MNQRDRSQEVNQPTLKNWGIDWFKSVQHAQVELAPLTVLVGKNSAGKSTLFQSILLLSGNQGSDSLQLNTPLFKGGTIADVVNRGSYEDEANFTLKGELTQKSNLNSRVLRHMGEMDPWLKGDSSLFFELDFLIPEGEGPESTSVELWKGKFAGTLPTGYVYELSVARNQPGWSKSDVAELDELFMYDENGLPIDPSDTHLVAITFSNETDESGLTFNFVGRNLRDFIPNQLRTNGSIFEEIAYQLLMPQDPRAFERGQSHLMSMSNIDSGGFYEEARAFLNNLPLDEESFIESLATWTKESVAKLVLQTQGDSNKRSVLEERFERSLDRVASIILSQLNDRLNAICIDGEGPSEKYDFYKRSAMALKLAKKIHALKFKQNEMGEFRHGISSLFGTPALRNPIASFFRNRVLYLGPLRESPKFAYTQDSVTTPNTPVGIRGEATYEILSTRKAQHSMGRPTLYVPPPGSVNDSKRTLQEATDLWLEYFFGSGSKVSVSKPSQFGITVKFGDESLTNVGVGVSQLLPIIVLCLISTPNQVILLEQPELHLHPALQQKLADFFIEIAKTGRQIIVETHSEYLITRLRLRTVQNPETSDLFKIVFAENDGESGTQYNPVTVDENGSLETWPEGFFDEASSDMEKLVQHLIKKNKNQD